MYRKYQCRSERGFVSHEVIEGEETVNSQRYPRVFAGVVLKALVVIECSQSYSYSFINELAQESVVCIYKVVAGGRAVN